MRFTIEVDYKHVAAAFGQAASTQVDYIAALTATNVGKRLQAKVKALLPERFDRPTPFTISKVRLEFAKKSDPTATVFFPDSQDDQGRNRLEYMRPGARGAASRSQKRSEFLLTQAGILPPGWVMAPGSYMKSKLDSFGNVPGQYYRQVIRSLQIKRTKIAKPISKASVKRAARMGVQNEFFAVSPGANKLGRNGSWLPSGVYQRAGRDGRVLLQYFKFIKSAAYRKRIDLQAEAQKVVRGEAGVAFQEAIEQAQVTFLKRVGAR